MTSPACIDCNIAERLTAFVQAASGTDRPRLSVITDGANGLQSIGDHRQLSHRHAGHWYLSEFGAQVALPVPRSNLGIDLHDLLVKRFKMVRQTLYELPEHPL